MQDLTVVNKEDDPTQEDWTQVDHTNTEGFGDEAPAGTGEANAEESWETKEAEGEENWWEKKNENQEGEEDWSKEKNEWKEGETESWKEKEDWQEKEDDWKWDDNSHDDDHWRHASKKMIKLLIYDRAFVESVLEMPLPEAQLVLSGSFVRINLPTKNPGQTKSSIVRVKSVERSPPYKSKDAVSRLLKHKLLVTRSRESKDEEGVIYIIHYKSTNELWCHK